MQKHNLHWMGKSERLISDESSHPLSLSLGFQQQPLSEETMDPILVPGTRFEFQFQICVYEHAILRIYISFYSNKSDTRHMASSLFSHFSLSTFILFSFIVCRLVN